MKNNINIPNYFYFIVIMAACFGGAANAKAPRFANIISDNAVLQRDKPINLWGFADPNDELTISFAGQSQNIIADKNGQWAAHFAPINSANNLSASIKNKKNESQTIKNLIMGDVYLCSGQSNMEFELMRANDYGTQINLPPDNNFRFINIARVAAPLPQNDILNKEDKMWQIANPQNIGTASAVCYFMAKDIQNSQNIPIGFINASWGGSQIEAWISQAELKKFPNFIEGLNLLGQYAKNPKNAVLKRDAAIKQGWKDFDKGYKNNWQSSINLTEWPKIDISDVWENSYIPQLQDFDGTVWFATSVNLNKAQSKQGAQLLLGQIDDEDEAYINGQKIGSTQGWDRLRNYDIAPNILKEGKNDIKIRVLDTGGGGGFWGDIKNRQIKFATGETINLDKVWNYNIGASLKDLPIIQHAPWGGADGLTTLYNGMIYPIKDYNIKGFAWYQGETNARDATAYKNLLPTMINQWRKDFNDENLPFAIVQLSSFGKAINTPQKSNWAALRDVQRIVSEQTPNTYLAISIDVGNRFDIHPTDKKTVGNRLARLFRKNIYGEDVATGPLPISANIKGDDIEINFKNVNGSLNNYQINIAIGFEICSHNDVCEFWPANANATKITLPKAALKNPIKVRYAWSDGVFTNLYDDAALPVPSFELGIEHIINH